MKNESAGDKNVASPVVQGAITQARLFAVMTLLLALVPGRVDAATASAGSGTRSGSQGQVRAEVQPTVTLLKPGAEPRKVLRFQPKAGDRQQVSFTMKMAMGPLLSNMPPISGTMQFRVKSVSANGVINCERAITDISMSSAVAGPQLRDADSADAALSALKGLTASGVFSSRGFCRWTDVKSPNSKKQLPAMARLSMAAMDLGLDTIVAPFPEEAVGVGGQWEVKSTPEKSGEVEKAVYEIVSIDGSRVSTKVTVTIGAHGQTPKGPALTGGGSGDIVLDLGHVMPTKGYISRRLEGTEPSGGKNVGMKMETYLRIEAN